MADKLLSDLAKGAWSSATAYTIGDIVTNGGSSYICVANSTNNEPPNATYWALLASKGTDGTNGTNGTNGANGSDGVSTGLQFVFDSTTTDSDPGSGKLRFNNATIASVTELYIDNTESGGGTVSAILDTFDDSTNTQRGYITIRKKSAPENFAVFSVSGSVTDGTGYRKITVTHVASNGSFSNTDPISFDFSRTGNKGADGVGAGDVVGPASATDGAVVLFDTTTGKLIKNSTLIPTTVGTSLVNLTNPGAITFLRVNANNTVTTLSAADTRTALGLVIGTNVQAWDADLDTWAGKTAPSGTVVGTSDSQTLTNKTLTSPVISSISNTGTVTLPTSTDTLVGRATTDTLTNKRVNPRTNTTTSSATPSINTDTTDIFTITALAAAITSMTTNLSGTPVNGQKLIIRIKDDGTARAITWGASFASRGATLPTTTVLGKYQYNGFIWNSTTSTWDCVASVNEG